MRNIFFLVSVLFTVLLSAQDRFTVNGIIKDAENGETIFGASVYFKNSNTGVLTNEYGFYSITATKGTYSLTVSYMGFSNIVYEIDLDKDLKLDFELVESTNKLDEVIVIADDTERVNIKTPQMSVSKLKIATIKNMPVVFGEVDILKSIQLLPGVTNNGEGSNGFNVRGGAVDQNLVLLDEAIIYSASHLFGFFSVFNSDAIKDVKLFKGSISPRFGGRVSSVLDVRQKEGNSKKYQFTGGIGSISSRLAIEGPVFKEKGSFLVAGRGSYMHLFFKLSEELKDNVLYFYDLNLKSNYEINENNRLYLSGYFGRDVFKFGKSFSNSYGNSSGNVRWNHIFNEKLFSNLSLIYSKYDYQLGINALEFDWNANINNFNFKYDLQYYANDKLNIDFGISGIYYNFNPGEISPTSETSSVNFLKLDKKKAFEGGAYVNAEQKISTRFNLQYGFRFSYFSRLGGEPLTIYKNDQPVVYNENMGIYESGTPIGQEEYNNGESMKTFNNFEPRLSLSFQLNELSSLKASYSRIAQYIHLLSNTTNVTPLDVWTPSGIYVDPQLSNQYALGYFKDFSNRFLNFSIEAYYKTIDNRIDYIDGANLIGNNIIETVILSGEARAYGLEFLLQKTYGKFSGMMAYTLSKSEQRTPGGDAGGPGINNGDWYNTAYDRTHDFSITGAYKFTNKWMFSTNFVFQTGRPVTYPNGQYTYEGMSISSYAERNANRLPAYHRLDISAIFKPNRKPLNKWKGEFVFGIYNVYNRKNAASITFGQNRETGRNEATRTAIFGIVPSVTYNFKF